MPTLAFSSFFRFIHGGLAVTSSFTIIIDPISEKALPTDQVPLVQSHQREEETAGRQHGICSLWLLPSLHLLSLIKPTFPGPTASAFYIRLRAHLACMAVTAFLLSVTKYSPTIVVSFLTHFHS